MRLEPRQSVSRWASALSPLLALLSAFAICALLIVWAGESPLTAYRALIQGALGSSFAITESLTRAIPLIFTGLAAAVAFRAKFWNIGAEGQLYFGALAATWLGTGLIELPAPLMIPVLFIAGALAGCLILLVPVLLKTYMKAEIAKLVWDSKGFYPIFNQQNEILQAALDLFDEAESLAEYNQQ